MNDTPFLAGRSSKSDFETVVESYKKYYNVSRNEAYDEISSMLSNDPKLHSISDLIGGLTDNKCHGKFYHGTSGYWERPYQLEKEAFAHFYEATARNDSEKLNAIKQMFPNAYIEFERMVDGI